MAMAPRISLPLRIGFVSLRGGTIAQIASRRLDLAQRDQHDRNTGRPAVVIALQVVPPKAKAKHAELTGRVLWAWNELHKTYGFVFRSLFAVRYMGTVKATAITYSAGCFRQRVDLILLNFLRPPDRQKPTKTRSTWLP
jgi:hypothetical protein